MKTRNKLVAYLLVAIMVVASSLGLVPGTLKQASAATTTYNFGSMSYNSGWGVSSYYVTNGALKVSFTNQYGEVKYTLPTSISVSSVSSITVNANTSGQSTAFKFYDANGSQLFVQYNCSSYSNADINVTPSGNGNIKMIGVMSQSNSRYTATVNSVKFNTNTSTNTGSNTGSTSGSTSTTTTGTLKGALAGTFGKVGNAVTLAQLQNASTLSHIKQEYNCITMENEMKPDAVLGYSATLMTVAQAKANGYYIPSGYTEATVPTLKFTNVDAALKIAYENGLAVRIHTLIWHSQTPAWFFKTGYSANNGYVSKSVMDARVDFYVTNMVKHISQSSYKSVVYAYDVVNEYLHNTDQGTCKWTEIYGKQGNNPTYVKAAFTAAKKALGTYGGNAKLFYNDYNTYQVADDIVALINYINGSGKVCDGVGMQCHLDVSWPSISYIETAINKFKAAGFDVQVTELDVTINSIGSGKTTTDQANYYYDLIKMLKGKGISAITFWGLYDSVSWRSSKSPLLFSSLGVKKPAYYSVLNAMK